VKQGLTQRGDAKAGHQMHVQIIVSRKDSQNRRLLSPLTNHRGKGKSEAHGQKFGQFNRVEFKERSEAVFDRQLSYGRNLEESFRYQNIMSNGTAQERAAMTLELRDIERERQQQQQEANRRQAEQLQQTQRQELAPQQNVQPEQTRSRGMRL
jgi:hypothetical protein